MVYTTHTQNGGAHYGKYVRDSVPSPTTEQADFQRQGFQPHGFQPSTVQSQSLQNEGFQPHNPQSYSPGAYNSQPSQFQQSSFMDPHAGYPSLIDPALLRAARQIYRQFYEAHPDVTDRPVGVAVNRYNYRGKLIFGKRPILLPQEFFIPFEQLQAELY